LDRRIVGPQSRSGRRGEEEDISVSAWNQTPVVQPAP